MFFVDGKEAENSLYIFTYTYIYKLSSSVCDVFINNKSTLFKIFAQQTNDFNFFGSTTFKCRIDSRVNVTSAKLLNSKKLVFFLSNN